MYDHEGIERKWRDRWISDNTHRTDEDIKKKKCYALVMFPYPSGEGLHIGHARAYIGSDIHARMRRMQGYRVLHPMGWDAFGLPAEGYAIRAKTHPRESTNRNIARFKEQCIALGLSYDWDRELSTTDPDYYRWTQWGFLLMLKRGLAYESVAPVHWCPSCKTGLANEDLEGGACERCGSAVERKPVRQWALRITEYADRLSRDLDSLAGWPEPVKEAQRNWIGRAEGYEIPFSVEGSSHTVTTFTTRPDTLFGCSFLALSPESAHVDALLPLAENRPEIEQFRSSAHAARPDEADRDRMSVQMRGVFATHPITGARVPVFLAEYVISGHGTGAVFGSPAHDERDFALATRHDLPILQVLSGPSDLPLTDIAPDATLINSGAHNGLSPEQAKDALTKAAGGKRAVAYRLQDWVFSRQRYWGEPIPIIHCESCGAVPVPEEDLPVTLPEVDSYEPTGTGESPLASVSSWTRVPCPSCGAPATRETNTMPQWAGSSWYHLRYIDPNNHERIVDAEKERSWMPVDMYTGGMEHATRHLIYARFWHKVLHDAGFVSSVEPYSALRTVGIVQPEGGGKMSKRLGNTVDPTEIAATVGADAVRTHIAHLAPFSKTVVWDSASIAGARRFLERAHALRERVQPVDPPESIARLQIETIESVTRDIASYRFNTAVSALMIFCAALQRESGGVPARSYSVLIRLLAPFAPFITEEIWHDLGNSDSVHSSPFPTPDLAPGERPPRRVSRVAVQVAGKTRGAVTVPRDSGQSAVLAALREDARLAEYTRDKQIRAFVPNRIISFI